MFARLKITLPLLALPLLFGAAVGLRADFFALDPGVRGDPAGAGGPIDGLSDNEKKFFEASLVWGRGSTWTTAQAAMRNPLSVGRVRSRILKLRLLQRPAPQTSSPPSSESTGRCGKRGSSSSRTAPVTAACMHCSPSPGETTRRAALSPSRTL